MVERVRKVPVVEDTISNQSSVPEVTVKDTSAQDRLLEFVEEQIEKMKNCENCKHKKDEVGKCELLMYSLNACLCKNKDDWELKE